MLIGLTQAGDRIRASTAEKGPGYHCPACQGPLVLHQGRKVIWHFKHQAASDTCTYTGETLSHLESKERLYTLLEGQPWVDEIELEYAMGDVRPDLWLRSGDAQFAFEVQISSISPEEIDRKLAHYARRHIAATYVLHPDSLSLARTIYPPTLDGTMRLRIPKWVAHVHERSGGLLYFLSPKSAARGLFPLHFQRDYRYREAVDDWGNRLGHKEVAERTTYRGIHMGSETPLDEPLRRYLHAGALWGAFSDLLFWSKDDAIRIRAERAHRAVPERSLAAWQEAEAEESQAAIRRMRPIKGSLRGPEGLEVSSAAYFREREVELRIHLPSNLPHAAQRLQDTKALLDASPGHSPVIVTGGAVETFFSTPTGVKITPELVEQIGSMLAPGHAWMAIAGSRTRHAPQTPVDSA